MPKRSVSPRLLPQLIAKKLLPRASQRGLEAINRRQQNIQPPGFDLLDRSRIQVCPFTELFLRDAPAHLGCKL
jgi:hypothetical protein